MNPRLLKTKRALQSTLLQMLEEHKLDAITVSDLCGRANINRTTFYKYYTVPADVLQELVENAASQVRFSRDDPRDELYDYMLACCHVFMEHKDLMKAFVHNSGNLSNLIFKFIERESENLDFMLNPTNNFIAGGISSLLTMWMFQGFPQSPEEMAKRLAEYSNTLLEKFEQRGVIS